MPTPVACIGVGHSPKASAANAIVNTAWPCTITLVSPGGTPWAMPKACGRNWPRNSVKLIAIRSRHQTFGLRTTRHGVAAIAKRSAVISDGDSSSSAIRLATKASPQMTATMTAMQMSAGFIVVFSGWCSLLSARSVRLGFPQQIGAVQRRVVVGRHQDEADLGQHAFDHPAEGRIFVAHVSDDALARKIVVLDVEIGP